MKFIVTHNAELIRASIAQNETTDAESVGLECGVIRMDYNCKWDQDYNGTWETSCENAFEIIEGTPDENGMKYCPYCGKKLIQFEFNNDDL
jgi:hypothetical protein